MRAVLIEDKLHQGAMRHRRRVSKGQKIAIELISREPRAAHMNPADFIDRLAGAIAQYPLVAILVAIAGGLLSTST
jgi:hypothetical protein